MQIEIGKSYGVKHYGGIFFAGAEVCHRYIYNEARNDYSWSATDKQDLPRIPAALLDVHIKQIYAGKGANIIELTQRQIDVHSFNF